jgi:hypothetical protein
MSLAVGVHGLIEHDGDEGTDVDDGGGLRPESFVGGLVHVQGGGTEASFLSAASGFGASIVVRHRSAGALAIGPAAAPGDEVSDGAGDRIGSRLGVRAIGPATSPATESATGEAIESEASCGSGADRNRV